MSKKIFQNLSRVSNELKRNGSSQTVWRERETWRKIMLSSEIATRTSQYLGMNVNMWMVLYQPLQNWIHRILRIYSFMNEAEGLNLIFLFLFLFLFSSFFFYFLSFIFEYQFPFTFSCYFSQAVFTLRLILLRQEYFVY